MTTSQDILQFWFEECSPEQWFKVDKAFDEQLATRFGELLEQAAACELYSWRSSMRGRVAEIIVLDQFSRNIHRGTAKAFANDALALALAQELVALHGLEELKEVERAFGIMPYMHSESAVIHEQAVPLFKQWTAAVNYDYELRHKEIIDRFGRYPHRNEILGRASTDQEIEFLKQPGSSF